jgi:hypothetical protein
MVKQNDCFVLNQFFPLSNFMTRIQYRNHRISNSNFYNKERNIFNNFLIIRLSTSVIETSKLNFVEKSNYSNSLYGLNFF